ncbi:AAA family ATPase [Methylotuvimicrobium alcaliphilum]
MELEKITIQKFKRISNLELNLAPINYLVGGNNAGKSSASLCRQSIQL